MFKFRASPSPCAKAIPPHETAGPASTTPAARAISAAIMTSRLSTASAAATSFAAGLNPTPSAKRNRRGRHRVRRRRQLPQAFHSAATSISSASPKSRPSSPATAPAACNGSKWPQKGTKNFLMGLIRLKGFSKADASLQPILLIILIPSKCLLLLHSPALFRGQ